MNLPDIDCPGESIRPPDNYLSAVLDNYKVIKTVHNNAQLALSETYFVRKLKPVINVGLKSCVDFRVFDF